MIASVELQKAIYSLLSKELNLPIVEVAKQNQKMPYIIIGQYNKVPEITKTESGYQMNITLHIFSESSSSLEAKTIAHNIESHLSQFNLIEIEHYYILDLRLVNEVPQIEEKNEDIIYHYIQEYEILLENKGE